MRSLDVMSYDDVFKVFHAFADDLGTLDTFMKRLPLSIVTRLT